MSTTLDDTRQTSFVFEATVADPDPGTDHPAGPGSDATVASEPVSQDVPEASGETPRKARRGIRSRITRNRLTRRLAGLARWDQTAQGPLMMAGTQVPALMNTLADEPGVYGYPVGVDLTSSHVVAESPHGLYRARLITSPNVVVFGDVGTGKSTLVKTELLRLIVEGGRGVVFDRKKQLREAGVLRGEYDRLSAAVGGTTIRFHRGAGKGTHINVLDPAIATTTGAEETSQLGQDRLLVMVTEAALGEPLTASEARALTLAHRAALAAAGQEDRVPTLLDVIAALREGQHDDLIGTDSADVAGAGRRITLALSRYVDGDLTGLIDGQTRDPRGQPLSFDAPLIVFDTSSLDLGSVALQVTMAVATAYVMSSWVNVPGRKMVVIEEGYSADGLGAVPAAMRDLAKRGRGVGASVWSVFHHISDTPAESPLRSLIQEAQLVYVFRQDKAQDIDQIRELISVDESVAQLLADLPIGVHLRRRSGRMPISIVRLARSQLDTWLTDSDAAMNEDASEET